MRATAPTPQPGSPVSPGSNVITLVPPPPPIRHGFVPDTTALFGTLDSLLRQLVSFATDDVAVAVQLAGVIERANEIAQNNLGEWLAAHGDTVCERIAADCGTGCGLHAS